MLEGSNPTFSQTLAVPHYVYVKRLKMLTGIQRFQLEFAATFTEAE